VEHVGDDHSVARRDRFISAHDLGSFDAGHGVLEEIED